MADILKHPDADYDGQEIYEFADGATVTLKPSEGKKLTVAEAIYMVEDVKFRMFMMMHGINHEN